MRPVHLVVPDSVDDSTRPSGGNTYDQRIVSNLNGFGWAVTLHKVAGHWPHADRRSRAALSAVLSALPDGAVVVLDGIVASGTPGVVVPEATRLGLVVLVHLPLGALPNPSVAGHVREGEAAVLASARAVVATSGWTRRLLLDLYALDPHRVHVAEPGADLAEPATGTAAGAAFVCVAAVVPDKGHQPLVAALSQLGDLEWRCTCAGALDLDPAHATAVARMVERSGIADRVRFVGPLGGGDLDDLYAGSDLLVVPSRLETYGLVVTEALARGLPVVATEVGGVPAALGTAPDGTRPGLLVPSGDVAALAGALRSWLVDADLRRRLRASASGRRTTLEPWTTTTRAVATVLEHVFT